MHRAAFFWAEVYNAGQRRRFRRPRQWWQFSTKRSSNSAAIPKKLWEYDHLIAPPTAGFHLVSFAGLNASGCFEYRLS